MAYKTHMTPDQMMSAVPFEIALHYVCTVAAQLICFAAKF